ncbi:MAG: O-antigen ligase family protein [Clostridia bacterium]|nr:O-antigen ligase family protein [Clostridia bacterium]
MTHPMRLESPQLEKKYGFFKLMSMVFLTLFIYSMYVLAYSERLNFISDIFFLGAIAFSLLNFIITKDGFKFDYSFFSLLLFVMYAMLTTFWALSDTGVTGFISTLVQLFGFYLMIRINIQDEKDLRVVLWAIYVGTVIMCLYTVSYYGVGEIISRISVGGRIGQEINQSNGMGIYCTVLNILSLYYIMMEKKYWCLISLVLSSFVMLGAGSRKSFLLMGVALLLLFMFKSKNGIALRFMAIAAVLIVAIYLVLEFADRESNYFLFRIAQVFEIFQDDAGTLRDDSLLTRSGMIQYGLELWSDNPVFGYGPEQYEYFYSLLHGVRRPPHSTFIQVLVGYGSIGFVLFYGIYGFVYTKLIPMLKNQRKYSILMLTLSVVFLINDIGANMLNNKYLYLFFAIYAAYITIRLDDEKGEMLNEDPYSSTEIPYQPDTHMSGAEG